MMVARSKWVVGIVLTAVLCGFILTGCGSSQELSELTNILENYKKIVTDYTAVATNGDQQKKMDMEKQIKGLSVQWAEKRNEFGSLITPQDMDRLANEFKQISQKLSEVKKKMG